MLYCYKRLLPRQEPLCIFLRSKLLASSRHVITCMHNNNTRISQHLICFSQSKWRHWAQSMTRQLISCRSWEAELVRPPARSDSTSFSSSGFPWRYNVLTQFFCTTASLIVTIRTSSLSRLLILAHFVSFNPWDLYYQGTKSNNNTLPR